MVFTIVHIKSTLYVNYVDGVTMIVALHVDDMLIVERSSLNVDDLNQRLYETFSMKDLGEASHILSMQITCDHLHCLLFLSQKDYINRVLEYFHVLGGKTISTLLPTYAK